MNSTIGNPESHLMGICNADTHFPLPPIYVVCYLKPIQENVMYRRPTTINELNESKALREVFVSAQIPKKTLPFPALVWGYFHRSL